MGYTIPKIKDNPNLESRLAFLCYLNEGFDSGVTIFYSKCNNKNSENKNKSNVIHTIVPKTGTCVIFDHNIWHCGSVVPKDSKCILRSDLIYASSTTSDASCARTNSCHENSAADR